MDQEDSKFLKRLIVASEYKARLWYLNGFQEFININAFSVKANDHINPSSKYYRLLYFNLIIKYVDILLKVVNSKL